MASIVAVVVVVVGVAHLSEVAPGSSSAGRGRAGAGESQRRSDRKGWDGRLCSQSALERTRKDLKAESSPVQSNQAQASQARPRA